MENFAPSSLLQLEEIQLSIYDAERIHYGGSQYWFPSKFHQVSGCGPVAAANITAHLSRIFPDKFTQLYPYPGNFNRNDFTAHMVAIRKYVKPGIFGLTSVHQFANNVLTFSKDRGIILTPHILDDRACSMMDAIHFISHALFQRLPVAILVLKHPLKELEEYAWHWMTITHLHLNPQNNRYYISVSTYGEHREIDLDLLWNHRRPKDIITLAYFN